MADVHDKATRSYNMSRIRSKDTKPEMIVRRFLHAKGFRYRLNLKELPGKPDIVLPKYNTVIFIHGCFWHGHKNCNYFVLPSTRSAWWRKKITETGLRDRVKKNNLKALGWRVIVLWECSLKPTKKDRTLQKLVNTLS